MYKSAEPHSARPVHAIVAWFWTGLPAALVFALIEVGAAAYGEPASLKRFAALLGYVLALTAGCSLALGAATRGLRVACLRLSRSKPDLFTLRTFSASTAGLGVFLGGSYQLTLLSGRFGNHELAALLSALLHVVLAATATLTGALVWRLSALRFSSTSEGAPRATPIRERLIPTLAVLVLGVAPLGHVLSSNLDGLRQLNPALWLGPLAAALTWAVGMKLGLGRAVPRAAITYPALLCVASGSFAIGLLQPDVPARFSAAGNWTSYVIDAIHPLSDFDGDGYSSLMGGGDCAPFDASVHPGAHEISNDGIDNNCVGGDSSRDVSLRPVWYELPAEIPKRLNVLYVSIETLRADHLSAYGYARDTSPNLGQLAKDASVFEHAYSPSTYTRLALPAIMSSLAPSQISFTVRPETRRPAVSKDVPWLPQLLNNAGYKTTAIQSSVRVFNIREGLGFERGFDRYDDSTRVQHRGGTFRGSHAEAQVDLAIQHVVRGKKPFFLWLHLLEPHYAYERAKGAKNFGESRVDLYDSEIWEVDRQIGRLLDTLKKRNLWDDTLVIISGDHGEEFGEHGQRFHGTNLYDPQLRTAFMLRVPGVAGQRLGEAASLMDLSPTVLNILGLRREFDQTQSRNLTPALFGQPLARTWFVSELFEKRTFAKYQAALIDWPLKLLFTGASGGFQLFDLAKDPVEKAPISAQDPRAAEVRERLVSFLEHHAKRPPK